MRQFPILIALILLCAAAPAPAMAQETDLTVTSPTDRATIKGTEVTVDFRVANFRLVPSAAPVEQAGQHPEINRPGEGHLHFMLDLQPLVVHEKAEPYTFRDLTPGEHRLMVELVSNDHSPLDPPVVRQIRFRVEPATTGGSEPTRRPGRSGAPAGPTVAAVAFGLAALPFLAAGLLLRGRTSRRRVVRADPPSMQ
jgi:hypothetical protein